jgi:hypothetical protein
MLQIRESGHNEGDLAQLMAETWKFVITTLKIKVKRFVQIA